MNPAFNFGQFQPGNSLIHELDPRAKIVSSFLLIIVLMLIKDLKALGLFGVFSTGLIIISGLSLKSFLNSIRLIGILIMFTFFAHVFFTPGETLWEWGIINVSREGLFQGISMSLKFLYIVSVTSLVTLTTSPMTLTDGLLKLFRPLTKVGLPAEELALMMAIALRFIPTLWEETDKIRKAQASRGAVFDSGSLAKRIRHITALMVPMLVGAFRRADELAQAMESRGFQVGAVRTRMKVLEFKTKDYSAVSLVFFLLILTIASRVFWQV